MTEAKIPKNFFGYDYTDTILQITKELFDHTPINYFDYTRIYDDGSWIFFTTKPGIGECFLDSGLSLPPNIEFSEPEKLDYIPAIPAFESFCSEVSNEFQIHHIFSYTQKYEKYIECYWFGIKDQNTQALNYLLNQIDMLKKFSRYFNEAALPLISAAEKNKIIIPDSQIIVPKTWLQYENENLNIDLCLKNKIHALTVKNQLTPREAECLPFLAKGYSAKQIARNLNISTRTVEKYIHMLKVKLNISSKFSISDILSK